jgi:DNA helicase-2/ATP-dependent DNA helicase PcrA
LHRQGHDLRQIAILVRAGFQTREFEERFIALALPYRVIGGPRFYERQEIRDAMAYLRLIHQPADDLAFDRIVNTPRRGIGTATIQLVHAAARAEQVPLIEAARQLIGTDSCRAPPATRSAAFSRVRPLARRGDSVPHTDWCRACSTKSATPACGRPTTRRRAGPARKPEGAGRRDGRVREPRGFLEHVSLVMDNAADRPATWST